MLATSATRAALRRIALLNAVDRMPNTIFRQMSSATEKLTEEIVSTATDGEEPSIPAEEIPECVPQAVLWGTSMKALVKETRAPGLTMMDMPTPTIGTRF